MLDDDKGEALQPPDFRPDNHPSAPQRDRPPVVAYDPHFGVLSPGVEREDFDERMWQRAA